MVHVLVVDDNPTIRSLLQELLTAEGYRVSEAADASQALETLKHLSAPVVMLLDAYIPSLDDGIRVLTTVATSPHHCVACGVILVTGMAEQEITPEVWQLVQQVGAPVLVKPFTLDELLPAIEGVTRRIAVASDPMLSQPAHP